MSPFDLPAWLALNRIPSIGPVSFVKLVEKFGNPHDVFKASRQELREVEGIRRSQIEAICSFNDFVSVEKEIRQLELEKISVFTYKEPLYPSRLKEISSFPPLIYVKGDLASITGVEWIGVVGSRKATEYGLMACRKVVGDLVANKIVIVSGFARGIDITAHLSAIEQGGQTVAVIGCGLGHVYPSSHRMYVRSIVDHGVFISEFPYFTEPKSEFFPRRNRLISGLSRGVLVVEASEGSGALITAQYTLDQNRDLFAIPGPISSENTKGGHQLIQQGAKLVTSALDILNDWKYPSVASEGRAVFSNPDEEVLHTLCYGEGMTPDQLVEKTGFNPEKISMLLTKLELLGKIRVLPGRRFSSL